MLYLKTNKIRKSDIESLQALKLKLSEYSVTSSKNFIQISKDLKELSKDDLANIEQLFFEVLSTLKKGCKIVIKIAGVNEEEVVSMIIELSFGEISRYDAFEYCLSTKDKIKVLK